MPPPAGNPARKHIPLANGGFSAQGSDCPQARPLGHKHGPARKHTDCPQTRPVSQRQPCPWTANHPQACNCPQAAPARKRAFSARRRASRETSPSAAAPEGDQCPNLRQTRTQPEAITAYQPPPEGDHGAPAAP
eukprot:5340880-Amphidinium_carterae.1